MCLCANPTKSVTLCLHHLSSCTFVVCYVDFWVLFALYTVTVVITRIKASLASLLISAQELLYAVKVELIDSLLIAPSLNDTLNVSMAENSQLMPQLSNA
jgi:hypothetical protein